MDIPELQRETSQSYIYNYGKNYNIVEEIDNKELFYYLLIEFQNGTKYISKPFRTRKEAEKDETEKVMFQKEPYIIKKKSIIHATEAMVFKYYDISDCVKVL